MWLQVLQAWRCGLYEDGVLFWRGSRPFTRADLDLIAQTAREFPGLSRKELAGTLCELLPWLAPNGRPRLDACVALLAELERSQGLVLPPVEARSGYRDRTDRGTPPPSVAVEATLAAIEPVTVDLVQGPERTLWNAMMASSHPLGFRRAFGAHLRYFVHGQVDQERVILGGLLYAAAANALEARDAFIGWDAQTRGRYRHHIVSSSRYLVLPTVRVPHLASHALALSLRRLTGDYERIYGYRPALVETFIEPPWHGTCYRACGFVVLGTTKGRGRQDRHKRYALAVKQVLVRPLGRRWRDDLMRDDSPPREEDHDDA